MRAIDAVVRVVLARSSYAHHVAVDECREQCAGVPGALEQHSRARVWGRAWSMHLRPRGSTAHAFMQEACGVSTQYACNKTADITRHRSASKWGGWCTPGASAIASARNDRRARATASERPATVRHRPPPPRARGAGGALRLDSCKRVDIEPVRKDASMVKATTGLMQAQSHVEATGSKEVWAMVSWFTSSLHSPV